MLEDPSGESQSVLWQPYDTCRYMQMSICSPPFPFEKTFVVDLQFIMPSLPACLPCFRCRCRVAGSCFHTLTKSGTLSAPLLAMPQMS